jgi:flagellar biosynthesis GTPase FlhF
MSFLILDFLNNLQTTNRYSDAMSNQKIIIMSSKKNDKGKWFHKLHQLQKRMTRMTMNEGHSEDKMAIRKSRIRTLLNQIKGRGKSYVPPIEIEPNLQ